MTGRAIDLLGSSRNDAYEAALVVLRGGIPRNGGRTCWRAIPTNWRRTKAPAIANADGCAASSKRRCCRGSRPARRNWRTNKLLGEQAFGEALDAGKLEQLGRCSRSTSIASSNGCWPCCCGSRTCGRGPSRADPFDGKKAKHGSSLGQCPAKEPGRGDGQTRAGRT